MSVRFVDTDTHLWEQYEDWTKFVDDPRLLDSVPRFVEGGAPGRCKILVEGTVFPANSAHPGVVPRGPEHPDYAIVNDPARRLEYMDSLATRVNVIFPSTAHIGTTTSMRDAEVAAGLCRAYNRYAADFAAVDPTRLRPTMIVPANHPEAAADEMRVAHSLGLTAIVLHPTPPDNIAWSDPRYDVMWRTAQALDLAVIFHETSAGCPDYGVGMQRYRSWPMFWFCSHVVEALLTLTELIFGGVLERFPRLRIALAEAHVSWIPGWLAMLDQNKGLEAHRHGELASAPALTMDPSDYFRRQCYVMAFPDDSMVEDVLAIAPDNLLVSSDFPHNSGKLHGEGGLIAFSRRAGIGDDVAEHVLVDNAKRFLAIA